MNAKSTIPDYEHAANLALLAQLRAQGFKIEAGSQSYRVDFKGKFIHGAGTLKKPHGRYREANTRDNLQSASRSTIARNERDRKPDPAQESERGARILSIFRERSPKGTSSRV